MKHSQWDLPHLQVPLLRKHRGLRTVTSTWDWGWVCGNPGDSGFCLHTPFHVDMTPRHRRAHPSPGTGLGSATLHFLQHLHRASCLGGLLNQCERQNRRATSHREADVGLELLGGLHCTPAVLEYSRSLLFSPGSQMSRDQKWGTNDHNLI